MADQKDSDNQASGQDGKGGAAAATVQTKDTAQNQSQDPGATPGSAEGDEQTVDESIRQKEEQGQL